MLKVTQKRYLVLRTFMESNGPSYHRCRVKSMRSFWVVEHLAMLIFTLIGHLDQRLTIKDMKRLLKLFIGKEIVCKASMYKGTKYISTRQQTNFYSMWLSY